MKTMIRVLLAVSMLGWGCGAAFAQSLEVSGGYSFQFVNPALGSGLSLNGWAAGAELSLPKLPLLSHFSLAADFNGTYGKQDGVKLHQYTYLAGPRFSQKLWRLRIFEDALLGNAHLSAKLGRMSDSTSSLAAEAGVGADIKLTRHFSLRPIQADYLITTHAQHIQNNFRYSSAVVWRF